MKLTLKIFQKFYNHSAHTHSDFYAKILLPMIFRVFWSIFVLANHSRPCGLRLYDTPSDEEKYPPPVHWHHAVVTGPLLCSAL